MADLEVEGLPELMVIVYAVVDGRHLGSRCSRFCFRIAKFFALICFRAYAYVIAAFSYFFSILLALLLSSSLFHHHYVSSFFHTLYVEPATSPSTTPFFHPQPNPPYCPKPCAGPGVQRRYTPFPNRNWTPLLTPTYITTSTSYLRSDDEYALHSSRLPPCASLGLGDAYLGSDITTNNPHSQLYTIYLNRICSNVIRKNTQRKRVGRELVCRNSGCRRCTLY